MRKMRKLPLVGFAGALVSGELLVTAHATEPYKARTA